MRKPWVSIFLAAMVCLAGCGKGPQSLPTTYPVHGKVAHKDGTPLDNGTVQFQSQAEPSVTTCAAIGVDGTYSLTTVRDRVRSDGAVAGPNRVVVTMTGHYQGMPVTVSTTYPTPYTVEPRDNEFNFVVDESPRR